jgi:hypothetical protein
MKTIKETIDLMLHNPVTMDMTYKYRNCVELSGFIIRKPKFIKHDITGKESCSFILFQINNVNGEIRLDSYSCLTYVGTLIEQLKQIDKVIFVATLGKLRHHFKFGDYTQVSEMESLAELDIELTNEWGKD